MKLTETEMKKLMVTLEPVAALISGESIRPLSAGSWMELCSVS